MELQFIFRNEQDGRECPAGELEYCFPGREFVLSGEPCHFRCRFGYFYPLPFITILGSHKAETLIAQDPVFDEIELIKEDEEIRVIFLYDTGRMDMEGKEPQVLRIVHERDFRKGFAVYRNWYAEFAARCTDLTGKAARTRDCFYLRRYFFNRALCSSHILEADGGVTLSELFEDDCRQTGGIDAALLFDYAYDPETGIRCGNAEPFPFGKKTLSALNEQIREIRDRGCGHVFAYFEPYLIENGSDWDRKMAEKESGVRSPKIRDNAGRPVMVWGSHQWHPCLMGRNWQQISLDFLKRVTEGLDCDGVYLDEYGNETQYVCRSHDHEHGSMPQTMMEQTYLSVLQKGVRPGLWMSEYPVPYTMADRFDIVLSDTRTLVNAYRFAHPEIRFIRILGTDRPVGDNVPDLNKSFFNGEGLWIDNNLHDPVWYSCRVKEQMRLQYRLRQKYKWFFSSLDVMPLYPVQARSVLCNAFFYGGQKLLTLLNPSESVDTVRISLDRGMTAFNTVQETFLTVMKDAADGDYVTLDLKPWSIGCILLGSGSR